MRGGEIAIEPHRNALPRQRRHGAARQLERLAAIGDDFYAYATRLCESERASDSPARERERIHEHFAVRAVDQVRKARIDRVAWREQRLVGRLWRRRYFARKRRADRQRQCQRKGAHKAFRPRLHFVRSRIAAKKPSQPCR